MSYNGWATYATWRVNLEIFDGMSPQDIVGRSNPSVSVLRDALKDYAINLLEETGKGLVLDYAISFLSEVDWAEIAEAMIESYAKEDEDETV